MNGKNIINKNEKRSKIFSTIITTMLLLSTISAFIIAFAPTAMADATADFDPIIGPVGTIITVTGEGWTADELITAVTVGGGAAVHTLTVDGDGNLSGTITVPTQATGLKNIVITGNTSGEQTFTNAFTVIAIATVSTINFGVVGPSITVTLTGDDFVNPQEAVNWTFDAGTTDLELDSVTFVGVGSVTVAFTADALTGSAPSNVMPLTVTTDAEIATVDEIDFGVEDPSITVTLTGD
ncbi:MAG: hypothetical protein NTV74_07395, partial [Euryarchaeota archaeon]|nr:hypothetical protein [Euryarchaeota archaeon]